jgi:uncharacterized membrane protein (DUF485 family)
MALFQPSRGDASRTAEPFPPGRGTTGNMAFQPRVGNASSAVAPQPGRASAVGYEAVRASRDFWTIQRRFGSFVRPACTLFIVWYFLFVIVAVFAPGFMRISVSGDVNVGLCFGVLQFVSTFAIAVGYRYWARRRLDPLSDRLRHRLDGGQRQ